MTAKHTPGEWSVRLFHPPKGKAYPISIDYTGPTSGIICHFRPPSCDTHAKHRLHDAKLMATSKELLGACMDMASVLNGLHLCSVVDDKKNEQIRAVEKAGRAVIAKAKGE